MKTVQIDCILELSFEENLTKGELVAKVIEVLNNLSYKEMGEMIQIDKDVNGWHVMDEDGEEE